MQLKFKKLHPDAILPTKGTHEAAAVDIYSIEDVFLAATTFKKVRTGLAVEIPSGYFGFIAPRSGKATKEGLILRSSNVVDADFRGEIMICCYALPDGGSFGESINIKKGERIAQMIIIPVPAIEVEEALELSNTERGSGGFGSTGK